MVAQELEPMLRRTKESDPLARINLIQWMTGKLEGVREELLTWSAEERRFLDLLLDQGEIRPEHLHSDPAIQQRILQQPMLNWKSEECPQPTWGR